MITDIVGASAFHKGFSGVWFLSARALEHVRGDFDPASIPDDYWGSYWTSMAEDFDWSFAETFRQTLREAGIARYVNAVFFDGARVLRDVRNIRICYPGGRILTYDNPYESWELHDLRALGVSRVLNDEAKTRASILRLTQLREMLRRRCDEMMEVRRTSSNHAWGRWIEDNLLCGSPDTLSSDPD